MTYRSAGVEIPAALIDIDRVLRDYPTGKIHPIEVALLDLLVRLSARIGAGNFHVISGYRSPDTNEMLRKRGRGVSAHSLHMEGKAIDVRVPGVTLRALRAAALALGEGGVGYYPGPDFVHVDTGRVRWW